MKKLRLPAVLLAAILQILPICRTILLAPAANSTFAIVARWAVGAAATLGTVDAVSGATDVYFTNPTNFTGNVNVPVNFTLTITNYGSDKGAYFTNNTPLPDGLAISTYDHPDANPPDLHGNISGVPTTPTNKMRVRLTVNFRDLSAQSSVWITILSNTAPAAPQITNQPASLNIQAGENADFSVGASGESLHYQWRFNSSDLLDETNSTLSLLFARTNQAGNYSVMVTNAGGSELSSNALLTVSVPPPPRLTGQSASGNTFTLSFVPVPGLTNTVETNGVPGPGGWGVRSNVPPPANTNMVTITDPVDQAARYYRVIFLP